MRIITLLALCLTMAIGSSAQTDRDDAAPKKSKFQDKTDYNTFHRQLLSLKEYTDERKKIPALQKANKTPVKVVAVIDTAAGEDDENKTLTGYIRQEISGTSVNVYEVTFDRTRKKITAVKRTGEEPETAQDPAGKKAPKKSMHKKSDDDDDDENIDNPPPAKHAHKKSKDDDDDGDDDEPASNKKQKDDDN